MLATRSFRLAATRYYSPAVYAWSVQTKIPLKLQQTTTWYTTPMVAAYSKDAKSGVLNSFSSLTVQKRNASATTANSTTESSTSVTNISITESSKSSSPSSSHQDSKSISQTSSPPSHEKSISSPNTLQSDKCVSDKQNSSTGPLSETDVKLPSREQVEGFLFKSVVYIWDFAFYIFALSRKLFETYIVNNPTIQHYWKLLLKRMDDARKEIKSK